MKAIDDAAYQAASRRIARFLAIVGAIHRTRRGLSGVCIVSVVAGSALLLSSAYSSFPEITLQAAIVAAAMAFAAMFALPNPKHSVEVEADIRLGLPASLSAYATESARKSALWADVVAQTDVAISNANPFLAATLIPLKWLPFGILGAIFALSALTITENPDDAQRKLLMRLANSAAQTAGEANAKAGDNSFSPEMLALLKKIERDLAQGKTAEALNALETVRNALAPAANGGIAKTLEEAGLSADLAELLATGKFPTDGEISVSAGMLENAAAKLGTGSLAASLAKAASFPAGSAEQAQALYAASLVAKSIAELERLKRALTPANGGDNNAVIERGDPLAVSAALREAVISSSYPIEYKAALIRYFSRKE